MTRIAVTLMTVNAVCLLSCGSPPPPKPSISAAPMTAVPIAPTAPAEPTPEPEPEPQPAPGFVQPEMTAGENGWEVYSSVVEVTPANAADMQPGTVSPEAAVIHFYAGLMLGDGSHEEVLVADRSKRLKKKLDRVVTWNFWLVRLERRKPSGDGTLWIKIYYEVEAPIPSSGKVDHDKGTDEAEVTQIDGKWYVSGVPT